MQIVNVDLPEFGGQKAPSPAICLTEKRNRFLSIKTHFTLNSKEIILFEKPYFKKSHYNTYFIPRSVMFADD